MYRKLFSVVLSLVVYMAVGTFLNADETGATKDSKDVVQPAVPQPTVPDKDECVVKDGKVVPENCVMKKDDVQSKDDGASKGFLALASDQDNNDEVSNDVMKDDSSSGDSATSVVPQPVDVKCVVKEGEEMPEDCVMKKDVNEEVNVDTTVPESKGDVDTHSDSELTMNDMNAVSVAVPDTKEDVKVVPSTKEDMKVVPDAKDTMVAPETKEAGQSMQSPVTSKDEAPNVFHDSTKKFSVTFPPHWEVKVGIAGMDSVAIAPSAGPEEHFRENINVTEQIVDNPIDLKDFYTQGEKALSEQLPGFKMIGNGETTVNGMPARWIEFSQSSNGIEANVKQYYVSADGGKKIFIVTGATSPAKFEEFKPVMEKVVQSFKLDTK